MSGTAGVLALRLMLDYAGTCGVDVPALLDEVGISEGALADPDGRVTLPQALRAWDLAATRAEDPVFGLHVAERARLGAFEALDYALWSSATFRDVLDRLARFQRLLADDLGLRVVQRGGAVHLAREAHDDHPQREDGFLALLVVRARELLVGPLPLREARFSHAAPASTKPYAHVFRCPLRFGAPSGDLVFDAAVLDRPVRCARPGLADVLDRYLRHLMTELPSEDVFSRRVRHAIARTLNGGRASLAATARFVHASPRTVQRRLAEHGVSHRAVVEEVRREMAERLLAERELSIGEIAYLLGYDDASGFRRAYRRWTGRSPSRGRAR
jgi:AraC-like DNA-binding protein